MTEQEIKNRLKEIESSINDLTAEQTELQKRLKEVVCKRMHHEQLEINFDV